MDVVITGIGLRSSLGDLAQSWQRLLLGETGIRHCQPFKEQAVLPLGLVDAQPAVDVRALTRIVLMDALRDAELTLPLPDCGVVIGSSRGNQALLEQYLFAPAGSSDPTALPVAASLDYANCENLDWFNALPHAAAVMTAQILQTSSIVLAPMSACATGISTIARGAELIDSSVCERVIAGSIETPVTRLSLAGFRKMGALATTGAYPFDQAREGFVLGEGGAILVLESRALAESRGARIYGCVMGAGLTADAHHISSPDPLGQGAKQAIRQALTISQLEPQSIDYIHAHGTATQLNDVMEASVIGTLFGDRPWVSSTKGATGHTLGGSSALGAAFSLMAIKNQVVPGCTGLRQPDFDIRLARQAELAPLRYALCNGFGFGGQNGAIVFGPA